MVVFYSGFDTGTIASSSRPSTSRGKRNCGYRRWGQDFK